MRWRISLVLSYVANLLGEDEDWFFELSTDMFPEDGCLWVYGVGDDGVSAFTKDGIDNLRQIIADERDFARTLRASDEVVIEATGNSAAVERLLRPFVKRVAVANPRLVKAIAYARVKTDKVDAKILATLHAAGFLPEIWVPDEVTLARRRQIAERMGVLAQLVRTKGRIQALLHANLIPQYKGHLFGPVGRRWLQSLPLESDERGMLGRYVDELERVSAQLANLDKVLAQQALDERAPPSHVW